MIDEEDHDCDIANNAFQAMVCSGVPNIGSGQPDLLVPGATWDHILKIMSDMADQNLSGILSLEASTILREDKANP